MKTRNSHPTLSLPALTSRDICRLAGLLAGTAVLGSSSALATMWLGGTSTAWNDVTNWNSATGGSGLVTVSPTPTFIATITADIVPTPTSMVLGASAAGRVDHRSGNAGLATDGDIVLGRTSGGNGTYNLANTGTVAAGTLSGFATGSGNLTIPRHLYVGGSVGAGAGTVNINTTGTLAVGGQLLIGNFGGNGAVNMDAGTLTVADIFEVGNGTAAVGSSFSMKGGTVTKSGAATAVSIGGGVTTDGGTGTANLNGGTFTAAGDFRVGQNLITGSTGASHGILNVGGTNLTVNGGFWVGNNTGAIGEMNFTGGTITNTNWVSVGRKDDANTGVGATGTVTMTGGTWNKSGPTNFIVGDTGTGTMTMSGGLVVVNADPTPDRGVTWVGNRNKATGNLTISGTAEFRSPRFMVGVETETTGTLNLNGGTVKTTGIVGGAGESTVHFNGSQLVATGNSDSFVDFFITADIAAGGLKVDSGGFNLAIPQDLSGTGGITKTGAGTLSLTGTNSYSGTHAVNAGKLAVGTNGSGIGNFTVANGATMGVLQNSGFAALHVPGVNLASGSSLEVDISKSFGNPSVAALDVTTSLTLGGPVTINLTDNDPDVGPVPLVTYAGAIAGGGNFVLGTLPLGVTANLVQSAGSVSLDITDVSLPHWRGNVSGNWDTSTANWINQKTSNPLVYANPMPVTFDDDPAVVASTVVLNGTVIPGSVTFDSETLAYTLNGTGKISGTTGLVKTGAANLTINTANNDYTGPTKLSGGTTTISTLANAGAASSLGAPSTAADRLVLDGTTLVYTGGNVTSTRGFTINAPSVISHASNITFSGPVASADGSILTKVGAGTLTLGGTSVTIGALNQNNEVQAGTLSLTGPGQTVSIPGQLYVGSTPNVPANLVIQNSDLTIGGFLALGRGNGDTGVLSTISATGSTVKVGAFSTGFDAGLATKNSKQTVTLANTNWTTTGNTVLAEKQNALTNLTLSGNSVYTANNRIQMAINATAVCNWTVQDTASIVQNSNWFSIGNDGTGSMTVKNSASVTTTNADFNIGDVGSSVGTLNIQDSATVSATGTVFVGKNSGTTGTVNISGGTFNSVTWVTIGRRSGATGFFNITGGTVNQTGAGAGFNVGENGTGTLDVGGTGVLNILGGGLYLSAEGTGTSNAVAHLNAGGTIIAKRVVQRDFNAQNYTEFRFNGGLLKAQTGAVTDFMSNHDLVSVDAGGAFIDSNGQAITISQVLTGPGALTKQGAGTLTLSGTNTYAGNTTVSAGTLSLSSPYLSNTATVSIASGAVLNLAHNQVDQVASLILNGVSQPIGTYTSATPGGFITGTGSLQVTGAVATPYDTWMAGFPSIPVADRDPGDDPDGDGATNAVEFALGGTPNSSGSRPKVYPVVADGSVDADTTNELLMTIAVRSGTPAFTGSPSPAATQDGYTYTVQGGTTLNGFTTVVTPVAAVTAGLPAVPAGYEYRTFSLTGSNGVPTKGFMRVGITP